MNLHPGDPPGPIPSPGSAITRTAPRPRPTIFISVASYCDPMLGFTLRSAYSQAADPSRLRFGVVEQALPQQRLQLGAQWACEQIRWLRVHALEARGPCWARAAAMGLYQGEDWYFQIDSHTWFEPGWDERLLAWSRQLAAHHPRHLLSCYPNPFTLVDGHPSATVVSAQVLAHVVADEAQFDAAHPVLMFHGVPVASTAPVPGFHIGAGCLWAPGRIVDELPYDPFLYFHGEEQAMALRAFTRGWDIFHPPAMPVYHLYHQAGAAPRPLHWTPEMDAQRTVRSAQLADAANRRLAALLWQGADLGAYGLGTARSLEEFASFSGIDYAGRRIAASARKQRFGY
ncbi:GlcNAc-transferase family protein [Ideonella sp. DXS22W]|uniref:GlcNAc-transferase family protein n=1 Tax=Pseudaquabacterium inlustre TaxID=2984192 RepID=A0ABU9CHI8_9BURK